MVFPRYRWRDSSLRYWKECGAQQEFVVYCKKWSVGRSVEERVQEWKLLVAGGCQEIECTRWVSELGAFVRLAWTPVLEHPGDASTSRSRVQDNSIGKYIWTNTKEMVRKRNKKARGDECIKLLTAAICIVEEIKL
jgi:hypothetical protein